MGPLFTGHPLDADSGAGFARPPSLETASHAGWWLKMSAAPHGLRIIRQRYRLRFSVASQMLIVSLRIPS